MYMISKRRLDRMLTGAYNNGRKRGRVDAVNQWLADVRNADSIHVPSSIPVLIIVGGNWEYDDGRNIYTTRDGRMAVYIPPDINIDTDVIIRPTN